MLKNSFIHISLNTLMIISAVTGVLFDGTSQNLAKAINTASERQAIYAYNIANASTPGFKPIRFHEEFDKTKQKYGQDEFNLEEEMAKMNENRLRHSAYTKLLSSKIQIAKKIATLGKGG